MELTELIIKKAGLNIDVSDAYINWWWPSNSQSTEHKRLTAHGCTALKLLVPYWEFETAFNNTGKELKALSKIEVPYHISFNGTITIFSKQLATMIKLYGSFDRYLELIQKD